MQSQASAQMHSNSLHLMFSLGDLYALYSLGITDLDPNSGTGLPTNLSQVVYLFMPGR